MSRIRLVLSTLDDPEKATALAERLVDEQLVACVNIIPKVTSIYKWKGKVERESEVLMVMKTTRDRLDDLIDRIRALHPYDVPEIVALPIEKGNPDYLAWVVSETGG